MLFYWGDIAGLELSAKELQNCESFSLYWLASHRCTLLYDVFNDNNLHYHVHSYFTVEQQKEPGFILADIINKTIH